MTKKILSSTSGHWIIGSLIRLSYYPNHNYWTMRVMAISPFMQLPKFYNNVFDFYIGSFKWWRWYRLVSCRAENVAGWKTCSLATSTTQISWAGNAFKNVTHPLVDYSSTKLFGVVFLNSIYKTGHWLYGPLVKGPWMP